MGLVRLCWCLGVILVLPNLDARTLKLIPAETKTVTTKGATHEISRYILVPDDETSGHNDSIRVHIIPSTVKNSTNKDLNNTMEHLRTVSTKYKFEKTIKPEDVKKPGLVKYHLVNGAHSVDNDQTDYQVNAKVYENSYKLKNGKGSMEHTKVEANKIPRKDSKTSVLYINDNNGAGKHSNVKSDASKSYYKQSTHTVTKAVSGMNGEPSKTDTRSQSVKTAGDSKKIISPSKITNIKYTDLPIKWSYTQSDEKGKEHALLASYDINKTFTLPGKRGRFKIIQEDDDEYDNLDTVLHKPNSEQSTSDLTRQTIIRYNNNKYFVDNTKKTIDDDDDDGDGGVNNENFYSLLTTKSNGHDNTLVKSNLNTYTEIGKDDDDVNFKNYISPLENSFKIEKSNSRYTNVGTTKSHTDVSTDNVEEKHTYSDDTTPNINHRIESKLVSNTNEAPTDVENIYVQKSGIVPTFNKTSSLVLKSDIKTVESEIKINEFPSKVKTIIADNIPSNKTYLNVNKNTFEVETVHENTESDALINNKNDGETIEPTPNTNNIQTTILVQKNANKLKVLPLKNNTVKKYSSQIEKIKTLNATNTKTSEFTHNTFGKPSADNSIIEITSLNNKSKVATQKNNIHTIEIAPIMDKNSSKTTIITKFENSDVDKVAVPLNADKTTETNVEIEIPMEESVTKVSVLENKNIVTAPKINIQDIVTSSQQNINENIITNQKSQKIPSFDFDFPITKSNNSGVLNYLGTKNSNEVDKNEDTQVETVSKVHQIKDSNKSSVSGNYDKITIPKTNSQIIAPKINNSEDAAEPKQNYADVRNYLGIINDNKDKKVDTLGIESAAENNKYIKQLKDLVGNLSQEINNTGRLEYTDSSTNTLSKTHIKTDRMQITPDGTEQLIDEHDEYSENTKPTIPKADFVDFGIESAAENNKNIKQLEDHEGNLSQEINNTGRLEYTDSSTNTLSKTHIKTDRIQLTPDGTEQLIDEYDEYSEKTEPTIPKADFVDFEIESAAENNKNIKQIKDQEINLTQEINNTGRLKYTDSSTNTLPRTHIKTDRMQITPDETKHLIDEHDESSEHTKPANQIHNFTPESNNLDLKFKMSKPTWAANLPLATSEFTPWQEKYENPAHFEQFDKVSEPNKITYEDDNDSNLSGYPYEGDSTRLSQITYREGLTDTAKSEDINNQYVNELSDNVRRNDANQYYHVYHVVGTNYPVPTNSYAPAYPYQAKGCTQSNNANFENVLRIRDNEFIDNQYLQYILNYLSSKNVMLELKRKFAVVGHGVDANTIRAAHINEHLQNLGIYNMLSQEQFHFLIHQLQKYETINQKNMYHENNIDDQPTPSNRIYVPNHYVIPYTYNVVPTNEVNHFRDDVYLHHYLLADFDVDTVNNAVGDLGTRVVNLVTYLRNLRVPDDMIIQFIAEAKQHLTKEVIQAFAAECQNRAYDHLGQRIDMIAKQVLQMCTQTTQYPMRYVIPHGHY